MKTHFTLEHNRIQLVAKTIAGMNLPSSSSRVFHNVTKNRVDGTRLPLARELRSEPIATRRTDFNPRATRYDCHDCRLNQEVRESRRLQPCLLPPSTTPRYFHISMHIRKHPSMTSLYRQMAWGIAPLRITYNNIYLYIRHLIWIISQNLLHFIN